MKRAVGFIAAVVFLFSDAGRGEEPAAPKPGTEAPDKAPAELSQVQSNLSGFVAVTNTPVIMKGIFGSRAPSNARGPSTETAVLRCLRWLAKTQNADGSWSSETDPKTMATGIVLLPFFAHGETPASTEFGKTVDSALSYLLGSQVEDGTFRGTEKNPAIEHGIIATAMCESYSMTKLPRIKVAAEKAMSVIIKTQRSSGLWASQFETEKGGDDIEASVWAAKAVRAMMPMLFSKLTLLMRTKNGSRFFS